MIFTVLLGDNLTSVKTIIVLMIDGLQNKWQCVLIFWYYYYRISSSFFDTIRNYRFVIQQSETKNVENYIYKFRNFMKLFEFDADCALQSSVSSPIIYKQILLYLQWCKKREETSKRRRSILRCSCSVYR